MYNPLLSPAILFISFSTTSWADEMKITSSASKISDILGATISLYSADPVPSRSLSKRKK
jgi:hypothetical protein